MEFKPAQSPHMTRSENLRSNIELKARLTSLEVAREVARRIVTEYLGIQVQVDTYFHCRDGRLKLREVEAAPAQLIWYARSDSPQARKSEYYLLDVPDPDLVKQLLTAALGVCQVVQKRREIHLYHNVRIHLDDVTGLGAFLEFEAVMRAGQDAAEGHAQLDWLCGQFGITPDHILAQSYGDMHS